MSKPAKLKMKWGRAALISLPFFAITIFWQAYDYIVPLMLSYHFHTGTIGYSIIMSIDNVVALIFLPLFGALSDKIHGKMGRRTPLILWGIIGGLIGLIGMNMADNFQVAFSATTMNVGAFIIFLIALLVAVFAMSMFRSPATALIADCFVRPQRTKANAMLNFLGGFAGVIFALIGKALISRSLSLAIYFVIAAMILSGAIYFIIFRENKAIADVDKQNLELGLIDEKTKAEDDKVTKLSKPELKSLFAILAVVLLMYMGYNAFGTHYTNYLTQYLQQPASWTTPYLLRVVLVLVLAFPAAAIASKIGRKLTSLIGLVLCGVAFLGLTTVNAANVSTIYIWFIIFAIGFPMVSINVGPMVLELAKNRDSGRYMGFYYFAATIAQIITPTLAALFIETFHFGYISVIWYAMIFFFAAAVACLFIKHGDVKPLKKDAVAQAANKD